jgi:hypothetical protein
MFASVMIHRVCSFDGCDQPGQHCLHFELAEPANPEVIIGVFALAVCDQHFRPEFVAEIASDA